MVEITQTNDNQIFGALWEYLFTYLIFILPYLLLIFGITCFIMIFLIITRWVWNLGAVENE